MAAILNTRSRDLKHGVTFNHCEVIILSIKSLTRLKDQVKSLAYKLFMNEIDFHRLFDGILKAVFFSSDFSGVLQGKSVDVTANNVKTVSAYQLDW